MPDLDAQIRAWCDDQDQVHGTSGCPSGTACIHAAVNAVRVAVRASFTVMDDAGGDRVRRHIAKELGIDVETAS